jgi:hypothetical protein
MQFSNISIASIKVLATVCTVRTTRFYIPGETSIAERIRKKSFDTGVFTLLRHIYHKLSNKQFDDIKSYIKDKVLDIVELADLQYH